MKKLTILFALITINIYGLKAQIAWPQNGTSIYYNEGNVGIGTTIPVTKLQVKVGPNINIGIRDGQSDVLAIQLNAYNDDANLNIPMEFKELKYNFTVGNVGIGTNNPQNKLDIAGTIRCTEVKVVALPWADFVFHPTYNLRSLGEVEQFIKTNKHLPEIPTAAEVKENGVGLGEMNAKLLQKVEELTLYLIELQKRMEDQQKQINTLIEQNPSGNTPATK